eukprot:CAMPEP_0178392872 /NCGR_PEP_ID=MMETSP0689_2-20121128/11900_1 /TAXON_ID=160604 /ORGANISM="Amphidinium massartii, Strain CS-259" /LENGTH=836 /DNA_ID=CAMNT_0020013455 /DNA_START=24 /DNA_END=2532 /DNA_ORIENTATION=-
MLSTGAAAVAGTVATIYTYNLGRFQFDANQAQNSAHQSQNMRLAQWSLFREDVRDLFGLTANNMTTYMVVGTLIVSCAMNFIWNGYKDYPSEPAWLLVIWNNTVFVCITFGLLSVWLALHGAISSNSACAKILTQAVRPPIPTLSEVAQVRAAQELYEAGGVGAFLQVPIIHTYMKRVREVSRQAFSGSGRRRRFEGRSQRSHIQRSVSVLPRVQEVLSDQDGGPGQSAVNSSHFWLLRQVQRSYACYDAYARISLSVSASQLLLVDAYYALGHFMSKSQGWPSPVQNTAGAWLAVGAAVFASVVIFRLDLFVRKPELRLIHSAIIAGPLVVCIATHLACVRTDFGRGGFKPSEQLIPALLPWALAILSCLLHAGWLLVVRWISEPAGQKDGLPLNFRSAHYLNVFGWHFSMGLGDSSGLFTVCETPPDFSSENARFVSESSFPRGVTPDDGGLARIAAEPFEVLSERPDLKYKARAMPWKYFSVTCFALTGMWAISIVVILFDPTYRESKMAPREKYSRSAWKRLNVTFPHAYFRPFALGCSTLTRTMAIGDHFQIYLNELPSDVKSFNRINDTTSLRASDFNNSWKGLGVVDWKRNTSNESLRTLRGSRSGMWRQNYHALSEDEGYPEAIFILEDSGQIVEEHDIRRDVPRRRPRHWEISIALTHLVEAIEPVGGHLAEACRTCEEGSSECAWRGWGIFAATDRGHVILLCPTIFEERLVLEPIHVVASLQRRRSAPWVVADTASAERQKIIGVHVDSAREILWLMAARADGVAEVRAWALQGGELHRQWDLPMAEDGQQGYVGSERVKACCWQPLPSSPLQPTRRFGTFNSDH